MSAHIAPSPEVRAEGRRRARRSHSRKAWRLLLTVLAIGLLAGLALVALTTAMGGLG